MPAEDYHRNYFARNGNAPYCNIVIGPKNHKLLSEYGDSVKKEFK